MAYDKHTWACREPITTEKLNHMEEGIASAGGDCDCGYECVTDAQTAILTESVTLMDDEGEYYADLEFDKGVLNSTTLGLSVNDENPITLGLIRQNEDLVMYGTSESANPHYVLEYDVSRGIWTFLTTRSDVEKIAVYVAPGAVLLAPCLRKTIEAFTPCFESLVFAQESQVTIPANSTATITLINAAASASNYVKWAALSGYGFSLNQGLTVTRVGTSEKNGGYIDHYEIYVRNDTSSDNVVSGTIIFAFCVVDCASNVM